MTKVTEKLIETTDHAVEKMAGALDKARMTLADAGDRIAHAAPVRTARAGVRTVDDYAHRSPWAFITGAAALALVVGLLLRRH